MFEDYTYERLLEDVLHNAPKGIDTRQGSIFYDAISGILLKVAKLYTDIDSIVEMTTVATATGEALDTRASEYAIKRLSATKAKYYALFEGTTPNIGERFYYDGAYFSFQLDEKGVFYFEAEKAGKSGNDIYADTPAVPVNNIEGLISATFGEIYERGSDTEDDESLRNRVIEKISGPAENGNKQHYKTWCESIDGVGRARIFPLWNGENTVKAVLIDTTGKPCGAAKVAEVQDYVDPASKGLTATINGKDYVVGDGLGNGKANIGAHFTAVAANALEITVSFTAELTNEAVKDTVKQEAQKAMEEYIKNMVLKESENMVVRVSAVGAILSKVKNLVDYTNLQLNGAIKNIIPKEDDVPVLKEVIME